MWLNHFHTICTFCQYPTSYGCLKLLFQLRRKNLLCSSFMDPRRYLRNLSLNLFSIYSIQLPPLSGFNDKESPTFQSVKVHSIFCYAAMRELNTIIN